MTNLIIIALKYVSIPGRTHFSLSLLIQWITFINFKNVNHPGKNHYLDKPTAGFSFRIFATLFMNLILACSFSFLMMSFFGFGIKCMVASEISLDRMVEISSGPWYPLPFFLSSKNPEFELNIQIFSCKTTFPSRWQLGFAMWLHLENGR